MTSTALRFSDDLRAQGVEVERETKVAGLEQEASGITARGTAAGGPEVAIHTADIIGCYGAHSVVRHSQVFAFGRAKYTQSFLLADCRVRWPADRDHSRFRIFINGASIGLFLPLDGAACSRVMATDHSGKADRPGPEASRMDLPELETAFRQATSMDLRLIDPI